MQKSIKNIINSFEKFAQDHKVIGQFISEPIYRNSARDLVYPLMIVEIGNSDINNGEIRIHMNSYFFDWPSPDEIRYVDSLSTTLVLAEDFITYFNKNEASLGFMLSDGVTAEPAEAAFEDGVIGWKVPFIVQTKSPENENLIPL